MANFQQIMQDEIRRLARKEMKPAMEALLARAVEMRKTILDLQKRIKALEAVRPVPEKAAVAAPAQEVPDRAVRVSAAGIIKLRNKLKLNQSQFAVLLDVSPLSVRQWEAGKTAPRAAQKAKIAACRTIGKRELKQRLAAAGIVPGKRTKRPAAPKAEAVKAPTAPKAPVAEKQA